MELQKNIHFLPEFYLPLLILSMDFVRITDPGFTTVFCIDGGADVTSWFRPQEEEDRGRIYRRIVLAEFFTLRT